MRFKKEREKKEMRMEKEESFYMHILGSERSVECWEENHPCCASRKPLLSCVYNGNVTYVLVKIGCMLVECFHV